MQRRPCILVAEDEKPLRSFVSIILTEAGFNVLEAGNGAEALKQFQQASDEIDLLVIDMGMPDMDGVTLAQQISSSHPDIPVLFMSGQPPELEQPFPAQKRGFLQKPFSPALLLDAVRRCLDLQDQSPPLATT